MRPNRIFTIGGAAALLTALTAMTSAAPDTRDSEEPSNSERPQSVSTASDAEAVAEFQGISIEEARDAEELLDEAGELQARLMSEQPDSFGGMHFSYSPVEVTVFWDDSEGQGIPTAVDEHSQFTVEHVETSLADLEEVQQGANEQLEASGVSSDTWINVEDSRIQVEVVETDAASASQAVEENLARNSSLAGAEDLIEIETVPELAQDEYVFGGMNVDNCTSGFVVRNANTGALNGTTAGHCDSANTYGEYTGTLHASYYSGPRDVRMHYFGGSANPIPDFWQGSEYRAVLATQPRDSTIVGGTVCKYGVETGATCGEIASIYHTPSYVPSAANTFVRVDATSGQYSDGGDSGGPVYYGNVAFGWHSGGAVDGSYGIFMSADYLPSDWSVALSG